MGKFFSSNTWRWIATPIVGVFALLFWYTALTVPMISATAPALIALCLTLTLFFIWPKRGSKETSTVGTTKETWTDW